MKPTPLDNTLPWFFRSGTKLFATLFLIVAIPLSTMVYLEINQISIKLKKQAVHQNNIATQLVARAVEEHYAGIQNFLESFASRSNLVSALRNKDKKLIALQLREMLQENHFLERAFITDIDGILFFSYPPDSSSLGADYSSEDWFRGVQKIQKTFISGINPRSSVPSYVISIAAPVRDSYGKTFAYLVNQETSDSFMVWLKKINPSFGGTIALIDRGGDLIATNEIAPPKVMNLISNRFIRKALTMTKGQSEAIDPIHKKKSLITHMTIESLGWFVFSAQPVDLVLAPLSALKPTLFGLSLACFSSIFFLGLIWLNSIHRYSNVLVQHNRLKQQDFVRLEQAVRERKLAEEALRLSNQELQAKIAELERLNRIMMGREKRILELKEELKAIRVKLSEEST